MHITIGDHIVDENKIFPFVVMEIGVNYYEIAQKLKLSLVESAKLMIDEAANAGADAVKFQIYKAELLATKHALSYWDTKKEACKSQLSLFKRYDKLQFDEYHELAKYAKSKGVEFLASVFDEQSVELTNELCSAFKIASADITNIPLIKHIARYNKPILLSTGASNIAEIYEALKVIKNEGNNKVILLHCVLAYPAKYEDLNLRAIPYLKSVFPNNIIGYSDHVPPDPNMIVLTTSVLLGARVIEKHFTLDKNLSGNDHYHSMDPSDLKKFIQNINFLSRILGECMKEPLDSERQARLYARRSITAKIRIPKGTTITRELLAMRRPGTGIPPNFLDLIIGKKVKKTINKDEILTWDHII